MIYCLDNLNKDTISLKIEDIKDGALFRENTIVHILSYMDLDFKPVDNINLSDYEQSDTLVINGVLLGGLDLEEISKSVNVVVFTMDSYSARRKINDRCIFIDNVLDTRFKDSTDYYFNILSFYQYILYYKKGILDIFHNSKLFYRSKYFLTLNNSLKKSRLELYNFLDKNKLMDKGFCSFLGGGGMGNFPRKMNIDFDRCLIDDNYGISSPEAINFPFYFNSYFNIVTEATFRDGHEVGFSEKIWKPIIGLQPFFLVGDRQSLAVLKKFGFKTFSNWVDESYDELNFDERIGVIFNECKRMSNLDLSEINDWYWEMEDIFLYNFNHFEKFVEFQIENLEKVLCKN